MDFYTTFLFVIILLFFITNVVIYTFIIENTYTPNKAPNLLSFLYSSKIN